MRLPSKQYRPSSPSLVCAVMPTNDCIHASSSASSCTPVSPSKFKRRHRDNTVSMTFSGCAVSSMNTVRSGGSSSVLRKALMVTGGIRSAPLIIATLYRPSVGLREIFWISPRIWSTVTTLDLDSGRTMSRSGKLWLSTLRQAVHSRHGSSGIPVSPVALGDWQFRVRASSTACDSRLSISPPTNRYACPSRRWPDCGGAVGLGGFRSRARRWARGGYTGYAWPRRFRNCHFVSAWPSAFLASAANVWHFARA